MTTQDQNADISNPSQEQLHQTLSNLVTDDYLAGPDHEAEPDLDADERFKQFVLAVDDDPIEAAFAYFADKDVSPEIHDFLAKFGSGATFADLHNAMRQW